MLKNNSRVKEGVLASWVWTIIRALMSRGYSKETILQATGLDPALLQCGGNRYSQQDVSRLWDYARALVNDPAFGMSVAKQVRPESFHVVGYAMSCSVTLQRALQRFTRYSRLLSDATSSMLVNRRDGVVLEFYFDLVKKPPFFRSYDTVLASVLHLLRLIASEEIRPRYITLAYDGPKIAAEFEAFFQCPVEYGALRDSMCFSKDDLDRPVLGADEQVAACLDEVANRDLEIRMAGRFILRVRDALVAQFAQGAASKAQTAQMLNMTERTLLRRLKEEGATYQSVLNELREELAFQYLNRGDMNLEDVALQLGFSEYGNFSRAFCQWTGVRPSRVVATPAV